MARHGVTEMLKAIRRNLDRGYIGHVAMERRTYRLPIGTIREIAAEAARRGISEAHYVRSAIDRQLGRDTCLDEIAQLREHVDERDGHIEAEVAAVRRRVGALERRVR